MKRKKFLHLCIIFTTGFVCLFLIGFAFLQVVNSVIGRLSIPVDSILLCLMLFITLPMFVAIFLKGKD
ncbi:hypothetical protein [Gimesia aquarii]|uniref:Uncharacterized protein n=1 Tax=Gimesia aquarii TaxID=2527964 RepID=A0A517WSN1_9PLAN|nr:hypothetical protein [Gimesia aquarii]QDU08266.1 hypothetical protein V202x_16320 [Gimesia aquarii]